ncbi:hypothetical protein [Burkholderia phage BCSR5]|nr:hypothetical protein [Burkholderia phage BCSR5]
MPLVIGNRITFQDVISGTSASGRISGLFFIQDTDILAKYEVKTMRYGVECIEQVMPNEVTGVNDMPYNEYRLRLIDKWRLARLESIRDALDQARKQFYYLLENTHGEQRFQSLGKLERLSIRTDCLQKRFNKVKLKLRERYPYQYHDPEIVNAVKWKVK